MVENHFPAALDLNKYRLEKQSPKYKKRQDRQATQNNGCVVKNSQR